MKQKGKRVGRKRKGVFQVKASSLKNIRHKPTAKSSRVTVRDHSQQCPDVQSSTKDIGLAIIEQSDRLDLVIGPLK